jgi:hypothetical protein
MGATLGVSGRPGAGAGGGVGEVCSAADGVVASPPAAISAETDEDADPGTVTAGATCCRTGSARPPPPSNKIDRGAACAPAIGPGAWTAGDVDGGDESVRIGSEAPGPLVVVGADSVIAGAVSLDTWLGLLPAGGNPRPEVEPAGEVGSDEPTGATASTTGFAVPLTVSTTGAATWVTVFTTGATVSVTAGTTAAAVSETAVTTGSVVATTASTTGSVVCTTASTTGLVVSTTVCVASAVVSTTISTVSTAPPRSELLLLDCVPADAGSCLPVT